MQYNRLSSASQSNLSPEAQAEIDAELRRVRGETVPLGRPSPPIAPPTKTDGTPIAEDPALTVSFSPPPDEGPFNNSLTLELKCDTPEARIFYALGTDEVNENGLVYSPKEPVLLTQSTLVAARASYGGAFGPILSARFEITKPIWQENEPKDQSDPTPHKESRSAVSADGWHVTAGSVRGKLHAHRGTWREDSFALAEVSTESGAWSVMVVSDGAGSAPLSRVGSKLACAATIASLQSSLSELSTLSNDQESLVAQDLPTIKQALVQAGTAALSALQTESQTRDKPLTAFAATLLVLVRRAWNDSQLFAALQVGDGAIALWDGTAVTLLGEADHGENSGETRFLTTTGIESELAGRVKFSIKSRLEGFAVLSDGISDDFFPEDQRLGELFAAVLPLVQDTQDTEKALLSWMGYEKRGSSDDRTLIVGWPSPQTEAISEA